jgi:hypothetical protein
VSVAEPVWQLAQVNVAVAVAGLDEPEMAGFLELLGPLDEAARRSPGFVWRPRPGEVSDAELAVFGDPTRVIANWSVWDSLDSFRGYVSGPEHRAAMRQRRRWFTPMDGPAMALWWVPAGHRPGGGEAHRRLELLRRHGPAPDSFTPRHPYPAGTATAGPWPGHSHAPMPPPDAGAGDRPPSGPALSPPPPATASGRSHAMSHAGP